MAEQWYYRLLGEEFGPVSEAALRALVDDGTISPSDDVRPASQSGWQSAATARLSPSQDATGSDADAIDLDSMLAPAPTSTTAPQSAPPGDSDALDLDAMLAPSSPPARKRPDANSWYYRIGGKRFGPFDFDTLFEHATSGRFSRYDEIRSPGADEWVEAQTIVGLFSEPEADLDAMLVDEEPLPTSAVVPKERPKKFWYYRVLNQEMGPVDFEGLFDLVVEGNLRPDDDIREVDDTQWQRADSLVGLFPDDLSTPDESTSAATSDAIGDEDAEDADWYFKMDDQQLGPVTFEKLVQLAQSGRLNRTDPIRLTKLGNWMDAESMVGLFPDEPEPPPAALKPPESKLPKRPKGDADDWAAAVLAEPTPERPAAASEPEREPAAAAASVAPAAPTMPPTRIGSAAPVQRPTFTPPPRSKARSSSSGGGFSLPSGLGSALAEPKVLGGIGALVLVGALFFVPWGSLFGGGAEDLVVQLEEIWGKVKPLHEKEAGDAEWDSVAGQVNPQLAEIAKISNDRGAGPKQPALQITLLLASQHIPKILEKKQEATGTQIKTVDNFLARAKEL